MRMSSVPKIVLQNPTTHFLAACFLITRPLFLICKGIEYQCQDIHSIYRSICPSYERWTDRLTALICGTEHTDRASSPTASSPFS